jgi:DNA-binding CsgD family transcriptional regulator
MMGFATHSAAKLRPPRMARLAKRNGAPFPPPEPPLRWCAQLPTVMRRLRTSCSTLRRSDTRPAPATGTPPVGYAPLGDSPAAAHVLLSAEDYRALVRLFARANRLSPREMQVLLCALEGWGREEAADRIGCAAASVGTYWSRICAKTHQTSQADVLLRVFHFAFDRPGGADGGIGRGR